MTKQVVDIGSIALNGADGDTAREAFTKVNANFTEVYDGLQGQSQSVNNKVDKVDGKSLVDDTEIAKLLTIEANATQNSADTYLLDRANHTGAQPISSVSGLQGELDTKEEKLVQGVGITIDRTNPDAPVISAAGGAGLGDVVGPSSSIDGEIVVFSGTTGKVIGGGVGVLGTAAFTASTDYATSTQGTKADTAVQPAALADYTPTSALGTAAFTDSAQYATTSQINAVNVFLVDNDAVKGSGALPYNPLLDYPVGSVGAAVKLGGGALREELAADGGYLLVSGGDYSRASAELELFAGVTRTIADMAGDTIRLDAFSSLIKDDPAIDNGPAINAILAVAAANKIPVDGYGSTFYTLTPILPKSGQILRRVNFISKGSPDGAGVAKSHIPVVHIDGFTSPMTDMHFEDVTVNGSRQLWPNISTSTASPEGGGGEDGGMHAWRISGVVTNSTWERCKGVNSGTAGWAIHNPLPSTTAIDYQKRNLTFIDCEGTGNREHGMFADSFKGIKWIRGALTGNGLDINTSDPLEHGNRGCRDTLGKLFGMPFDLEAYGPNFLGSMFTDFLIESTDCRGNAIMATIYNPIASNMAGFQPARNIRLIDCDMDSGLVTNSDRADGTDGLGLKVLGNIVTVAPFNGIIISSRISGRPSFNGVTKLDTRGSYIESLSPKVVVSNSNYFDVSCSSLSPEVSIVPQPVVNITKNGGAAGAAFALSLLSTRARSGGGFVLSYSVAISGATAAGGLLTATINPPVGYVIDDLKWDAFITATGAPVRSVSFVNGLGSTAGINTDTSADTGLTASLRLSLCPIV